MLRTITNMTKKPVSKKRVRPATRYANQRRSGHSRAVYGIAWQQALLQLQYLYHNQGLGHLSLALHLPVDRRYGESAFERVCGSAIRNIRPRYPSARFVPHTCKPGGLHLHGQWYHMYIDASQYNYVIVEVTEHKGPQRFHLFGDDTLLSRIWGILRHLYLVILMSPSPRQFADRATPLMATRNALHPLLPLMLPLPLHKGNYTHFTLCNLARPNRACANSALCSHKPAAAEFPPSINTLSSVSAPWCVTVAPMPSMH